MLKPVSFFVLFVGLVSLPTAAAARELPRAISIGEDQLHLNGTGVYEASLFNVDVFEAGLYVAQPTNSASQLLRSEQPRCLVLRFKRNVSRDKLVEAAKHALADAANGQRLEGFLRSLPDAASGDVMTFIYRPRRGMDVRHNRRTLMRVDDEDLARDFFASWVGPAAVDEGLSRALLGRR